MRDPLPSFRNPPVIETALSVQFKPLAGLRNAHLGLYWAQLRNRYPRVEDAEPIEPTVEKFPGHRARLPSFRVRAGEPAARLQMSSEDRVSMVQLQNGRLIYNWRGHAGGGDYPRWHQVLPVFQEAWATFQQFVEREALGEIVPNQWEVTYVNHLLCGREWDIPKAWPQLLPGIIGATDQVSAGDLESFSGGWHFALPDRAGRLHVELRHGFTGPDQDAIELLILQLTARGGVPEAGVDQGLELGREAIVRTFGEITGEHVQEVWGREHEHR